MLLPVLSSVACCGRHSWRRQQIRKANLSLVGLSFLFWGHLLCNFYPFQVYNPFFQDCVEVSQIDRFQVASCSFSGSVADKPRDSTGSVMRRGNWRMFVRMLSLFLDGNCLYILSLFVGDTVFEVKTSGFIHNTFQNICMHVGIVSFTQSQSRTRHTNINLAIAQFPFRRTQRLL